MSETSVGFLRENPFSLMRQHAVLNALTKMTLSTEDERTVNEYLGLTCQVIEKIRPVLTGLYHQGEKLKDSMQSLMDFAQKKS
ncbi:MAG: hypothetical protein LRY43_02165 [Gammaproteobacteria bacterium]|nr:hypothetical protein [Gammaproteobacteria bacterium]